MVSVRVNVLALTLAEVLVAGSINSRSCGSPVGRESVRILDMFVQDAGHVLLGMVVVGEVHREAAEMSKCVTLIVMLGPETQSPVGARPLARWATGEDFTKANDTSRLYAPHGHAAFMKRRAEDEPLSYYWYRLRCDNHRAISE